MKKMNKIVSVLLAVVMVLAMSVTTMAQDKTLDPVSADNATITISNASKGETYSVYRLFDATVTGAEDGSIAYQGTIPASLEAVFEADTAGNISVKENVTDEAVINALSAWVNEDGVTATISEVSDGSVLNFKGS